MSPGFNAIGRGLHAAGPIGLVLFIAALIGLFAWFIYDAKN